MRLRIVLVILLLGILFPMRWIGHYSSTYEKVFDAIFGPEWMHIVTHIALYAGVGALLFLAARLHPHWFSVLKVSGAILAIGILQEFFQWLTLEVDILAITALQRSLFDLEIDLLGGLLGIALLLWVSSKSGWGRPLSKHE